MSYLCRLLLPIATIVLATSDAQVASASVIHVPTATVKIVKAPNSELRGEVVDPNGKPIENATVVVSGRLPFSDMVARTSKSGAFVIDSLVPGETYSITVVLFGFHSVESKSFVPKISTSYDMKFVLKPREVVVRKAKAPVPAKESKVAESQEAAEPSMLQFKRPKNEEIRAQSSMEL